jgi:voltage-gated potassium channel
MMNIKTSSESFWKIGLFFLMVILSGTAGYYFIEKDWSLFDSFYMTIIAITTVGFGEIKTLSTGGRVFTVFIILLGLSAAALFATNLAKTLLSAQLGNILGANKMKKKISRLKGHYIICGFGGIGSTISQTLHSEGIDFIVVDDSEESVQHAINRNYLAIKGQATYDTTLYQANIQSARGLVISLGDDSINMYVALAAREINRDLYIIARGYKPHIEKRMIRAGADIIVYPLKLGGRQMANLIINQYRESDSYAMVDNVPGSLMGYTLQAYHHFNDETITVDHVIEKTNAYRVLELKRAQGEPIENPPGDMAVKNKDCIVYLEKEDTSKKSEEQTVAVSIQLAWSDDYCVGIESIDNEHKRLFELTSDFLDALKSDMGKSVLAETFDKLIDYTCYHFKNEEQVYKDYDYPLLEEHALEHVNLTEKVMQLNANKKYIFSDDVAAFLTTWLTHHILEEDLKFAAFLEEQQG